ncbi:formate/nitrite transporter family protein [Peptacetobacter hiranonis]|uniref:Formate/nitrite transporter n=1 Tax=Peptacetobacter hiranonis (strain DSM 13275 / JCM 10541 / KCTC 15199 / TO-931) TaxID=500633 RepID=B6FXQ7_PEPHT|nr:formate/nitrite transporter family protein [Peptacetobacter hiranonis]EEA85706.1 formate/nitrite transporter [Peptacetobacter hiranonis DSM 13275]QEK21841.1 putative formate transporter 1 [Peptacetobacter hiranonis]
MGFQTITEVIEQNIQNGIKKTNLTTKKLILLGIAAGFFIGIGAEASSLAMHGISNVGLARTVAGAVFPIGLMLIVLLGGELFTGNCLISMAVYDKKAKLKGMIRNLTIVYISNFIGAALMAWMINNCGQLNFSDGGAGAFTIKVALGKVGIDPIQAIVSGILCNVLVCLAIFMAATAKDVAGKCIAIFFPIFVFVISGFEHCVANMYYIPAGIFAAHNPLYAAKATELYGITAEQLSGLNFGTMFSNLVPVTIGNIIGGMVFVGLLYWYLYRKKEV